MLEAYIERAICIDNLYTSDNQKRKRKSGWTLDPRTTKRVERAGDLVVWNQAATKNGIYA